MPQVIDFLAMMEALPIAFPDGAGSFTDMAMCPVADLNADEPKSIPVMRHISKLSVLVPLADVAGAIC
ncbi:hypothetical protein TUM17560_48660 [Serratia marcescens]|nr:hypothetical protein TUM17560_48660 [Serratia marcescens]